MCIFISTLQFFPVSAVTCECQAVQVFESDSAGFVVCHVVLKGS
jgi:hypothetical protein